MSEREQTEVVDLPTTEATEDLLRLCETVDRGEKLLRRAKKLSRTLRKRLARLLSLPEREEEKVKTGSADPSV